MRVERVLASAPGGHLTACDPTEAPLIVADSWLVTDGQVRAIDKHRRRFFGACIDEAAVPIDQLWTFWQEVLAELPREGTWFPRVELCADSSAALRLRIRPAPPLAAEVQVWVADVPDPRIAPHRKGPDLGVLAKVRERAAQWGAQEALLTTRSGVVLEAANSSVLWWEGNDLCAPSATLPTLAGVTAGLILDRAQQIGLKIVFRRGTAAQLDGREVWLVNALHGIRPVTGWPGSSLSPGTAVRARQWQTWLAGLAVPLPTIPPSSASSVSEVKGGQKRMTQVDVIAGL